MHVKNPNCRTYTTYSTRVWIKMGIGQVLIIVIYIHTQIPLTIYIARCHITADIHGRSQVSYTAPCNGVVSHWAQIGSLWVFANHTYKNKRRTNASMILACRAAFCTCLSSRSDRSRCRWHANLKNHGYFDYRENPKTPNLSPIPR